MEQPLSSESPKSYENLKRLPWKNCR